MRIRWPWRRRAQPAVLNPSETWTPPPDGGTDGPPNPVWITRALDAVGANGPAVDVALGGKEPMVDLWEAGRLVPTPEQLEALCCYTGRDLSYFYQPTPRIIGRACPGFRPVYEDDELGKAIRRRVEAEAEPGGR